MLGVGLAYRKPRILVPGRDYAIGCDNPATLTPAKTINTLPAGMSWDSGGGMVRVSAVGNPVFENYDFDGLPGEFYGQQDGHATFRNCNLGLSGFTTDRNAPYLAQRSGNFRMSLERCSLNGYSYENGRITRAYGGQIVSMDLCDCINWPLDFCDPEPVAGVETVIKRTRAIIDSGLGYSFGLHSDGTQIVGTKTVGLGITFDNVMYDLRNAKRSTVTAPFNIGVGGWTIPLKLKDCILLGGAYNLYLGGKSLSTVTIENMHVKDGVFGIVYPGSAIPYNCTIDGVTDFHTGQALQFRPSLQVSNTSRQINLGSKTFTLDADFGSYPAWAQAAFDVSQVVRIGSNDGGTAALFDATVTANDGTTLTVNVTQVFTGNNTTHASWVWTGPNITRYPEG